MRSVAPGAHLTLHYSVAVEIDGQPRTVVDTFAARPATLMVGQGALAQALESCLIGMGEGEEREFRLAPGAAYGPRSPELVRRIPEARFVELLDAGATPAPGAAIEVDVPGLGRVGGVLQSRDASGAVLDFNHPLAGHPVVFRARILGVL